MQILFVLGVFCFLFRGGEKQKAQPKPGFYLAE